MSDKKPQQLATIEISLRAQSGYRCEQISTITVEQWERICAILSEPKQQGASHD